MTYKTEYQRLCEDLAKMDKRIKRVKDEYYKELGAHCRRNRDHTLTRPLLEEVMLDKVKGLEQQKEVLAAQKAKAEKDRDTLRASDNRGTWSRY